MVGGAHSSVDTITTITLYNRKERLQARLHVQSVAHPFYWLASSRKVHRRGAASMPQSAAQAPQGRTPIIISLQWSYQSTQEATV